MDRSCLQRVSLHEDDQGDRLDVVLARRLDRVGRATAKGWIAAGRVLVNGRRATKSQRLVARDEVLVDPPVGFESADAERDDDVDVAILFETNDLVVADKPAGMPSHPLRIGERGTLANGLVAKYPEMRGVGYGPREPGILHRLDTGTSGALLAARNAESFDALKALLRLGEIEKRYLALCVGEVAAQQVIAIPIAGDPKNKRRVVACVSPIEAARLKAQPARTEVLASKPCGEFSLVEVRTNSARRHQVRAHLAAIGHPLAGDLLYGGPEIAGAAHHRLHASSIAFVPPAGGERVVVSSPLPDDWPADARAAAPPRAHPSQ